MSEGKRRLALLGVLAALTGALAATVARRRRGGAAAPWEGTPHWTESTHPAAERDEPRMVTCTCGTEYRMTGVGRHRVYWPADAPDDEPVLGDECPECGEPLPAEPEGAAT
jgi:hypothetical protein